MSNAWFLILKSQFLDKEKEEIFQNIYDNIRQGNNQQSDLEINRYFPSKYYESKSSAQIEEENKENRKVQGEPGNPSQQNYVKFKVKTYYLLY